MGDYKKALTLYLQALQIRKTALGENHPSYATSLNNLASLYKSVGDYEKALPIYLQALEINKTALGENHPDYASSLNDLASLYERMGGYEKALPLYLQALQITKTVLSKNHPDYAVSLNNLASLYQSMGDYEKALPLHLQALQIRKTALGENHPDYAASLNNLAVLYQSMGDYEKALPLHLEMLQITKIALGENHPSYATSLNNIALLYQSMGNYEKALPLCMQTLQITKTALGENHPDYATSLNNLAGLYKNMGNYEKALPLCLQTLQITKTALGENHPDYAASLNNLALLYESMGLSEKALPLLVSSIQILYGSLQKAASFMDANSLIKFMEAVHYQAALAHSFINENNDAKLIQNVFDIMLMNKGLALRNSSSLIQLMTSNTDRQLDSVFTRYKFLRHQVSKMNMNNMADKAKTDSLEDLFEKTEQEIMRQSPGFRKIVENRNITWKKVQQSLKPGEAAIEFVEFDYWDKRWTDTVQYAAYIVLPQGIPKMIKLCTKAQLEQQVNNNESKGANYAKNLYTSRGIGLRPRNASNASIMPNLYKLLWKPIDSLLKGTHTIYFAPDGLLHRINPAAIYMDSTKTLGDIYSFHLMGSTRDIVGYQSPTFATNDTVLSYGNIRFEMDSTALTLQHQKYFPGEASFTSIYALRDGNGFYWPDLPGTARELKFIQEKCRVQNIQNKALSEYGATEESFTWHTSQKMSPAFIHVATHGFFYNKKPEKQQKAIPDGFNNPYYMTADNAMLRSGLVFAGANRVTSGQPTVPGIEDGIITAQELTNANLVNTKLMVLSACETGLGSVENSEGVFGLQRALRMAGCKNLLMSLWKVPDDPTSTYMNFFYSKLLVEKATIYQAFQYAQKEMRKLYPGEPFYWAGFVLLEGGQ